MSIVACILQDPSLKEQTRLAFQNGHDNIHIDVGLMEEGIKRAEELAEDGFEVFISRGRTAYLIKNANPEWFVLETREQEKRSLPKLFLNQYATKMNRRLKFTPNALKELTRNNWLGNIPKTPRFSA